MMDPGAAEGIVEAGRRKIVAVVNPATRRNATAVVDLLLRLAPPDVDVEVRLTTRAGQATALARDAADGTAAVVAVGGDGTVADVATAIHGRGVPLGVVPAGSTNIVARELGIPKDLRAAVALLFGPHRLATIDVGLAGERCFLHMAGAGFDSRMFAGTNPRLKRRVGWLAYLPPAARNLRAPAARFTIVADGETTEATASLVLVANGGSIVAPGLTIFPGIRKDDGLLDVLIFTATGIVRATRTLGRIIVRRPERSPFVLRLQARHVALAADPPLPVQLDGDVVTRTPASFGIAPGALRVIVPPPRR